MNETTTAGKPETAPIESNNWHNNKSCQKFYWNFLSFVKRQRNQPTRHLPRSRQHPIRTKRHLFPKRPHTQHLPQLLHHLQQYLRVAGILLHRRKLLGLMSSVTRLTNQENWILQWITSTIQEIQFLFTTTQSCWHDRWWRLILKEVNLTLRFTLFLRITITTFSWFTILDSLTQLTSLATTVKRKFIAKLLWVQILS